MASRLNPSENNVSERDYEQKFNRSLSSNAGAADIKEQELTGDRSWQVNKKNSSKKVSTEDTKKNNKNFWLKNRLLSPGRLKRGSAFFFIFGVVGAAVWYASVLAPNILLVNTKEIYTNDLADATTALEIYTQISYLNKIGPQSASDCKNNGNKEIQSVKCRLTSFSRYEKQAFERQGWIVIAEEIGKDNRDNQNTDDDEKIESRFKVNALLPPKYTQVLQAALSSGMTSIEKIARSAESNSFIQQKQALQLKKSDADKQGNTGDSENYKKEIDKLDKTIEKIDTSGGLIGSILPKKEDLQRDLDDMFKKNVTNLVKIDDKIQYMPIVSGPQLWLYSQLSAEAKEQVWSVFNPRSSFFHDARFIQRLKSRYNMSKNITVAGNNESAVEDSFDSSVGVLGGGIDEWTGQTDPTYGTSLAALSTPLNKMAAKTAVNDTIGLLSSMFTQPPDTNLLKNLITKDDIASLGDKGPLDLLTDLGSKLSTIDPSLEKLEAIIDKQLPYPAKLQVAANVLALNSYSYTDLMCSWYTIGKISSNALIRAKASTAARFALQYLKAADSIKAGSAQEVATNVLAGKLAQDKKFIPFGQAEYGGGRGATDSLIYRMTAYGDFIPSISGSTSLTNDGDTLGQLGAAFSNLVGVVGQTVVDGLSIITYNLSAYESIATMALSWAQVLPNAAAFGSPLASNASQDGGALLPPPINLGGLDRKYCLSGETFANKQYIKGTTMDDTKCPMAVAAMAPPGMSTALAEVALLAQRTCPPVNPSDDNPLAFWTGKWRGPFPPYVMWPSKLIVQATMTPYIATWFGVNTMITAAATQLLYTSQATGFDANYALFSGMGELLGDMAMSRGLMPSNTIDMAAYLHVGELLAAQTGRDDIARAKGKQNPFDPYNKFSFFGSFVRRIPSTVSKDSPVFASLASVFGVLSSSAQQIGNPGTANAFYFSQPNLLTFDKDMAERELQYMARLSSAFCPFDFEAISIGITPDIMCNVRYSMPFEDIPRALDINGLIDYMTTPHPELYDAKLQDLTLDRIALADKDIEYPTAALDVIKALPGLSKWAGPLPVSNKTSDLIAQRQQILDVQSKAMIDKNGKVTPGSEYDKYLTYCVNRSDPWGRSAVAARYNDKLSSTDKEFSLKNRTKDLDPYVTGSGAYPYAKEADLGAYSPRIAVTATEDDLEWYTGKKCTRLNTKTTEMLSYFRAYTTLCSVDGSMSGKVDCSEPDNSRGAYSNPFYLNNDILFTSWY